MSFLQDTALLHTTGHHGPNSVQQLKEVVASGKSASTALRSKGSIAALVEFVRNPVETLGEAVGFYDTHHREVREEKQSIEHRKRLLYLTLRNVC